MKLRYSLVFTLVAASQVLGSGCRHESNPSGPAASAAAPPAIVSSPKSAAPSSPEPPSAPVVFAKLPIRNSGAFVKDLVIDAPDGATWEERFTNTIVTKGSGFKVVISVGKHDVRETKEAYAGPDSTIKLPRYEVETPDTLVFEGTAFGVRGYHFVTNVKIASNYFSCTDSRAPNATYTRAEVDTMLQSCRTLRKK